jgi:hypothetical protein
MLRFKTLYILYPEFGARQTKLTHSAIFFVNLLGWAFPVKFEFALCQYFAHLCTLVILERV